MEIFFIFGKEKRRTIKKKIKEKNGNFYFSGKRKNKEKNKLNKWKFFLFSGKKNEER
jgi:hypothetical protein